MNVTNAKHHTPVASYIPIGIHDGTVPMGKYYPTNYESRMSRGQPPMRHSSSHSSVSSTRSISMPHGQQQQHQSQPELDAKSRLQQYQRDMMAQTRMAAGTTMSGALSESRTTTATTPSSAPRNPFPYGTMVFGASVMGTTPVSPRLHPLGSPGPVTPMNLEESQGDYLSKGQNPPTSAGLEHARIRR